VRRSFYWKRFTLVIVVFVALCGGLYAVNHIQVRRHASMIKTIARKAEADIGGDHQRRGVAIGLYARYLKFHPEDEEAACRYVGLLREQLKALPSSDTLSDFVAGAEKVLRSFPQHPEVRRELAQEYLKAGRVQSAREHLDFLLKSPPPNPTEHVELLELRSLCDYANRDLTAATERLQKALQVPNTPTEVSVRVYDQLLKWLHDNRSDGQRETKIATLMRELREKKPFSTDLGARVVLARFELFRRDLTSARADVNFALSLPGGATHPEALLAAAELEVSEIQTAADVRPKLAAARALLEKAVAHDPKHVAAALYLAEIVDKQGDRPHAREILRVAAEALGPLNDLYFVFIDRLIDLESAELAERLLDRVKDTAPGKIREGYFRGRLALLRDDWAAAEPLLREATRQLAEVPEHHKRALLGLARVAELRQNPDEQLRYCRQALNVPGPILVSALVGEAEALAKAGKISQAVVKYETLVVAYQVTALRPTLARLRLIDTLSRPPQSRNWLTFDSEDTLGPPGERSDEIQIILAQSLAARNRKPEAIAILEGILKKEPPSPQSPAAWVNLARIKEAGRPDAALVILDEAQKTVGDTVDLRLARADAIVYRAKPPTAQEFLALGENAEKFNKSDRYRLWLGLGYAARAASYRYATTEGRKTLTETALTLVQRAIATEPRDLMTRGYLIDLAVAADRKDLVDQQLEELIPLEGPDGPIRSLALVMVRLPEVRRLEDKGLRAAQTAELRRHAENTINRRPGWSRAYVGMGMLDDLDGFTEKALENYRKAISLGERDEFVIRRTVELYRERKEDALAAGLLDELSTQIDLPQDLERFRAIFAILNQPLPRSEIPTINRIAPADSRDYRILLLRGSLLAAIREDQQALEAFRQAIAIANPPAPEAYESLVGQLLRTGQTDLARRAVLEAEKYLSADNNNRPAEKGEPFLTLGKLRELIGDLPAAEGHYRRAIETAKTELAPNRRMVEFLMRTGRMAEADALLLTLLHSPAQDIVRWARRYLAAVSMMAKPNRYEKRREALALIEQNLAVTPDDPEDLKARAVIWTVDPHTREQGIQVLNSFWKESRLTPDEAYLLGSLTFDQGPHKIPESVKYFEYAARPRPGITLEHLAAVVRVYLALDKLDVAEVHLERLKLTAPRSWEAVREEARLLARKQREALFHADTREAGKLAERIRKLLFEFPGHDTPEAIRSRTGPLLEELGFYPEAENLYKRLLTASDSAAPHVPLATLYIQQRRSSEAIALARAWESKAPVPLTALLLTQAVRAKRPDEAVESQIAAWLDDKVRVTTHKPELALLLESKAVLLDAQGKYDEAIAEYRRALSVVRTDSAVNNLAMILALHRPEKADEAISLMDDLISLRGPAPSFLDTRAVACIVKGGDALDQAVRDLHMALLQRYKPVYLFHLGLAYNLQGKRRDSVKHLEEARQLGITLNDVHPLERKRYLELLGPDRK